MTNIWLKIDGLRKSFDGVKALAGFSCSLREGEILGLIGPNGAGKTTLFNVISGFLAPESGNVVLRGISLAGMLPHRIANAGIARTFQDLRLIRQLSVLDNVLLSFRDQPGERLGNIFFRRKNCQVCNRQRNDRGIKEDSIRRRSHTIYDVNCVTRCIVL